MKYQFQTYRVKRMWTRGEIFAIGFAVGFVSAITFVILIGM